VQNGRGQELPWVAQGATQAPSTAPALPPSKMLTTMKIGSLTYSFNSSSQLLQIIMPLKNHCKLKLFGETRPKNDPILCNKCI